MHADVMHADFMNLFLKQIIDYCISLVLFNIFHSLWKQQSMVRHHQQPVFSSGMVPVFSLGMAEKS